MVRLLRALRLAMGAWPERGPVIELRIDEEMSLAEEFQIARLLNRKRKALQMERSKRFMRSQAKKGLCRACPNQAKAGCNRCDVCLQKHYARRRKVHP